MKNDPEFNIEFVQLVEKYPILYNYTLTGHSYKPEVEKAWADIGAMLNETGTACQEKWRILRGGFNRYIKKKDENPPGVSLKKPYYLAKYMDFLLPFLKCRAHSGNIKLTEESPNDTHYDTETVEDEDERETFYDHCEVVYDDIEDYNEVINKPEETDIAHVDRIRTQKRKPVRLEECNGDFEGKKSRLQIFENPDLMFLKSLLPDMALLDKKNKMKFKIEMLNSLNRLLYNISSLSPDITIQNG